MDEEGLQKTEHEKIFIGKLSEFNIEDIRIKVNELLKVAEQGNQEKLKVKLREVVPTYTITNNEVAITQEGDDD